MLDRQAHRRSGPARQILEGHFSPRLSTTSPSESVSLPMRTIKSLATVLVLCVSGGASAGAAESVARHLRWSDKPEVSSEKQAEHLRHSDATWAREVFPLGNGRHDHHRRGTAHPSRRRVLRPAAVMGPVHQHQRGFGRGCGHAYALLPDVIFTKTHAKLWTTPPLDAGRWHAEDSRANHP